MTVKLDYFKPSGKWYAQGEYESFAENSYKLLLEVETLRNTRKLPGLMVGHSDFIVLINFDGDGIAFAHLLLH